VVLSVGLAQEVASPCGQQQTALAGTHDRLEIMGRSITPWWLRPPVRTALASLLLPAGVGSVYTGARGVPPSLSAAFYVATIVLAVVLFLLGVVLLWSVFPQLRRRLVRIIDSDLPSRPRVDVDQG
jgi:hypothetical protein